MSKKIFTRVLELIGCHRFLIETDADVYTDDFDEILYILEGFLERKSRNFDISKKGSIVYQNMLNQSELIKNFHRLIYTPKYYSIPNLSRKNLFTNLHDTFRLTNPDLRGLNSFTNINPQLKMPMMGNSMSESVVRMSKSMEALNNMASMTETIKSFQSLSDSISKISNSLHTLNNLKFYK